MTLIAAAGNGHTDQGKPVFDDESPDYPDAEDSPRDRNIDNSCLTMPSEGTGVIGVTAIAPSKRKSYYSDYGLEQADVSAPGGDSRDGNVAPSDPTKTVLSPYPLLPLQEIGLVDEAGNPTNPAVAEGVLEEGVRVLPLPAGHVDGGTARGRRRGAGGRAVRHAGRQGRRRARAGAGRGAAAGHRDRHAVPGAEPVRVHEPAEPIPPALCEGTPQRNGFYGDGIVDAQRILIGH